jgi:Papain family cysteine protease
MAKTTKAAKKSGKVQVTAESRSTSKSSDRLPSDASNAGTTRPGRIRIGNRELSSRPETLGKRKLDILPDMPDIRDRIYQPNLRALHAAIFPRLAFSVRDQGNDSSCTGFSLAHVIDVLQFREIGPDSPRRVSARMLYEMAKRNDEWGGSAYEGSSIRGAVKGFFRNGVCSEARAPDVPGAKDWALTYEMAKEAREMRLGAYFRVQPDLSDYHAALNEVGVIFASAQIHSNWKEPLDGKIAPGGKTIGGHAFALVGYNDSGFWVLNSWGSEWGQGGIAHWSYEDWAATVMDAWVLQLGVRAPSAFGTTPRISPSSTAKIFDRSDPHRADIVGHFINIDDGRLVTDGKYGSPTPAEMNETVSRLTSGSANSGKGYDHLVIYAHGGLNSLPDEARRIATWKRHEIFSRNRLYNFHLMWGSGFIDEVFGRMSESPAAGRMGAGVFDWLFEAGAGKELGSYAWRNMKQDARVAFDMGNEYGGGFKGLQPLLSGLDHASTRPKLHLVGHSAGSIVLGYLLSALKEFKLKNLELASIHLMAPACTVDFFKVHFGPYLSSGGALKLQDKLYLYNLKDELELDDTVSSNVPLVPSYSHSLLYLVSRAYEDKAGMPLAGMQKYVKDMPNLAKLDIAYSKSGKTASSSHGGFDNDVATMTSIMSRVAGGKLESPPTEDELTGY